MDDRKSMLHMMDANIKSCTVYHGTNLFAAKIIQYYGIWLDIQRKLTDFSGGFYVTLRLKQAKKWAGVRAAHPQIHRQMLERLKIDREQYFNNPDVWTPAYLAYELDIEALQKLNGLIFPLTHELTWPEHQTTWEEFVQSCRNGLRHSYDYVYGPVGGRHGPNFDQVISSGSKDQLSLNSRAAINCLSNLRIVTFNTNKIKGNKVNTHGVWDYPSQQDLLEIQGKSEQNKYRKKGAIIQVHSKDAIYERPFLQQVKEELIKIGNLSNREAAKMVKKSWITTAIKEPENLLNHEPASYWAYLILAKKKGLWQEEYEEYLMKLLQIS